MLIRLQDIIWTSDGLVYWFIFFSHIDEVQRISNLGWGAVSDLSLISDLSQKFKHDLLRVKSELKLSQKQHLTPDLYIGQSMDGIKFCL